MKIEIDLNQKWAEVAYFYNENTDVLEKAMAEIEEDARFDVMKMNVGQLVTLIDGGVTDEMTKFFEDCSVGEALGIIKCLRRQMRDFADFMRRTTPPETPEGRMARHGLVDVSTEESVLLTMQRFYGLHGLEEAQKMSVYEYIVARRDLFNSQKIEYNMRQNMKLR